MHMATVRSGNLQLSRRLSGLDDCCWAVLSPQLDGVAADIRGDSTITLVPVPATGAEVDLLQQLMAAGQQLSVPNIQLDLMGDFAVRCKPVQSTAAA